LEDNGGEILHVVDGCGEPELLPNGNYDNIVSFFEGILEDDQILTCGTDGYIL
jgi:hypothetical protein